MTDPIQPRSTPPLLDLTPHPSSPGARASAVGLATRVGEGALDAYLDSLAARAAPSTDAIAAFVRAQAKPVAAYVVTARTEAVQAKLDAFMKEATPTYRLPDGGDVAVPAFFRMGGNGKESTEVEQNRPLRTMVADRLGVRSYLDGGRPTLRDIRTLTQGLIDAGKLDPSIADPVLRVQTMAWNFGVGIDCAAYVQKAVYASQGGDAARYGLKALANEDLMSLSSNAKWENVGVAAARPGDVLTLAANEDYGHATIVYEHRLASPAQRDALRAETALAASRDPKVSAVLADPKLHVLELDSSWGAGGVAQKGGGVQRRTWLFGESTGWLCQQRNGTFAAFGATPFGHAVRGPFRAKVQP